MKSANCLFILAFLPAICGAQSLDLDKSQVCGDESVIATALPPSIELVTPAGTNNQNGYMFDVTATNNSVIKGFRIAPVSSGATYEIYYRTGSHVGREDSSAGWTLLDTVANVPSAAPSAAIDPGFDLDLPIIAGQTLAFYITATGATSYTYYDNGTAVGTTLASDSYLTIKEGVGKAYPFGTNYTTRNFVGAVIYEPEVVAWTWNTGETTQTISANPNRSAFLASKMEFSSGFFGTAIGTVPVIDLEVQGSATPRKIQAGQNSTLAAAVTLNRGIATDPNATNSQNGAMFDLEASDNLSISGFTISSTLDDPQVTGDYLIAFKTGSHVGFEGVAGQWTTLSTFEGVPDGDGRYLALPSPIDMVPGQTVAFYITRTDGGRIHYASGTSVGDVAVTGDGLTLLEGTGLVYPFGTTYKPRVLSTIVHFSVEEPGGLAYNWSSGGATGSVLVAPLVDTTYTVEVTKDGCTEAEAISVLVGDEVFDDDFEL